VIVPSPKAHHLEVRITSLSDMIFKKNRRSRVAADMTLKSANNMSKFASLSPVMVKAAIEQKHYSCGYKQSNEQKFYVHATNINTNSKSP
jgi:hypothetical protein